MTQSVFYKQAPITEALLDLRVANAHLLSIPQFRQELSSLANDYPTQKEILDFTRQTPLGLLMASADGKQVFQARQDGMTFSRLAPYGRWQIFRDEARRLWTLYRELTNPQQLLRVTVRYINRLDLPSAFVDLKEYLRTSPEISPALTQELSGYFMQLQLPQHDLKALLVLNQATVPSPSPEQASLLLDIELSRDIDLVNDEVFLWDYLEQLRLRKNQIFNGCLTEKMKELIQ